ncbi:carbamoylphosphate synthase large subunit short form [Desulfuribacillus stibiiarsenatis]|uniref:Carbamoylphosphate synthase large subunit short form n=1 Tax=Desulfuribacillus stibiiarsenatis TaxID=1390249 RepID=A0A1E5L9P5_9FIRM|nr:ATP-grasp domain-containing protein [Desulfuribacillus stibiiarsenatis]OEH86739.1 carbamoylphosphate synthase large subunit short form [Desulfuribacillus stibiiarsenatis]
MNVLVFPCGSEIGLEINRALSNVKGIKLFGASSVSSNHGKYVYENYIGDVPHIHNEEFIGRLNELVESYEIDVVFPAHDSVVLELSKHIDKVKYKIITSPYETCFLCRSKLRTYNFFKDIINTPYIFENSDIEKNFPIFMKPDIGEGSRGVHLAHNKEDIDFYLSKDPSLLLLEYLPGSEYTIDCFTNTAGQLLFVSGRERVRISNGISVETKPVELTEVYEIAHKINNSIPLQGAWFFQLKKRNNGDLVLLEIAPRIAGSMGLVRNMGVNLPLLSIYDKSGIAVSILANSYDIVMDRALHSKYKIKIEYNHVYIDLDDTIIFNGKLVPTVMHFIIQCINRDIKVHLLSKHRGEIISYLERYRIKQLFDTITRIDDTDEKHRFINQRDAIFIDDSYQERISVSQRLKIPTFDINSIESLIDWRV